MNLAVLGVSALVAGVRYVLTRRKDGMMADDPPFAALSPKFEFYARLLELRHDYRHRRRA